jgi:hypothetical protein
MVAEEICMKLEGGGLAGRAKAIQSLPDRFREDVSRGGCVSVRHSNRI